MDGQQHRPLLQKAPLLVAAADDDDSIEFSPNQCSIIVVCGRQGLRFIFPTLGGSQWGSSSGDCFTVKSEQWSSGYAIYILVF